MINFITSLVIFFDTLKINYNLNKKIIYITIVNFFKLKKG